MPPARPPACSRQAPARSVRRRDAGPHVSSSDELSMLTLTTSLVVESWQCPHWVSVDYGMPAMHNVDIANFRRLIVSELRGFPNHGQDPIPRTSLPPWRPAPCDRQGRTGNPEETQSLDFSLRELARRAGVSHNAPYKHFADKRELLAAVSAAGFETLTKRMARKSRASAMLASSCSRCCALTLIMALKTRRSTA